MSASLAIRNPLPSTSFLSFLPVESTVVIDVQMPAILYTSLPSSSRLLNYIGRTAVVINIHSALPMLGAWLGFTTHTAKGAVADTLCPVVKSKGTCQFTSSRKADVQDKDAKHCCKGRTLSPPTLARLTTWPTQCESRRPAPQTPRRRGRPSACAPARRWARRGRKQWAQGPSQQPPSRPRCCRRRSPPRCDAAS